MLPNAEIVHQYFRGTSETIKYWRLVSVMADFAAAAIALHGIVKGGEPGWKPFVALTVALLGVSLRRLSDNNRTHAQWCRKKALRSFSSGVDLDSFCRSNAEADAPVGALWLVKQLPSTNLDTYYEPTRPYGDGRLHELYSYSAFFTWRLQRIWARTLIIISIVLMLGAFGLMYYVSMNSSDAHTRVVVLDVVCTVILSIFAARSLEAMIAFLYAAAETRKLYEKLVGISHSSRNELNELVDEYDAHRFTITDVPTPIYRIRRKSLENEWRSIRNGLK